MHPMKLLFAMSALMAALLTSPARADAIPCNVITCGSGNCAKVCTNSHTGQQTTCGQYYNWECTHECARGQPTHYTNIGFFEVENHSGGPLDCDLYLDRKVHYTDSCGNSFYTCEAVFWGPTFCAGRPDEPLCTGGV